MKYFIDCGFYVGKAMEYYVPFLDDSWKIYAFEPNTQLPTQAYIDRLPFQVEWVKKAVWIEDGTIDFYVGGREDASYASSEKAQFHPEHDKKLIKVPCIDLSKFISKLEGTIVVSMDVEGAEFPILEKMLKDRTVGKIDLLDIEFHDRLVDRTLAESSLLRRALEGEGVLVKLKI